MRIRLLLPLLSASLLAAQRVDAGGDDEFAAAAAGGGRATVTVHAWAVSAATSTPFAKAVYGGGGGDATWQLLGDKNEEEERDGGGDELVRVGLAESDGMPWRGTVTTRRLLRDGAVVLRLEPASASVWFVEVRPRSAASPKITVVKTAPGVTPELNKPIVLTADGKIPVPEVEKTLLQKYWWVLLAAVFLLISGGGGGE